MELEAAIRERPDDWSAWLVYGDWLLERHDARGELIQLEHRRETARSAEQAELRRQIDELKVAHEKTWERALPEGASGVLWKFGFAIDVAVAWSLESSTDAIVSALAQPLVRGLKVIGPAVERDDDGIEDDGNVPPPSVDLTGLDAIDLARLAKLDLSYINLGQAGAEILARSQTLAVTTLDLRYCGIGNAGLATIANSRCAASVRQLHLQMNGITDPRPLQRFANLVELDLRYNEIGFGGAGMLLDAPFMGSLARLDLYKADVGDDGARELAKRLPPALRGFWRSV